MGNIGTLSTTTGSDMVGLRCPVGETKVLEISDVAGFTAGSIQAISDCLVLPLDTVTSGISIAAYEAPRVQLSVLPASALIAGDKLAWRQTEAIFESGESQVKITAIVLETKAAGISTVMCHFNGYGFEDTDNTSDALFIV